MIRFTTPHAGCMIYLMLSIVINLFILILRISAHEAQNNGTVIPTPHDFDATAAASVKTMTEEITTETVITFTADNAIENKTDEDSQQFTVAYQHPMGKNLTIIEHKAAVAAALVRLEKDDTENELQENAAGIFDLVNEALATIVPMTAAAASAAKNSNGTTLAIGTMNVQTTNILQRNATVSRDQLNSRAVIKSSSASAAANNNTITQKHHKPDAPMLNYIFDSHLANKHRHYDPRYGPHFDDVHVAEQIANVSALLGSVAYLNCRIRLLQDKTVTWLKREQNNSHIQLLTIGTHTYTFDKRFSVEFEYPNNWRLRIADANKSDDGLYECQISTHPPRAIRTRFFVKSPEVFIVDEFDQPLVDKYYEVDSTIELMCTVRHVSMLSSTVHWYHGNETLNYDMTRGGINVKTDLMENGANSTLFIAKVRKTDTGNYTCSIGPNGSHTINVQVLNGESLVHELYRGSAAPSQYQLTQQHFIIIFLCRILVLVASHLDGSMLLNLENSLFSANKIS